MDIKEYQKLWYQKNKSRLLEKQKEYDEKNKDKIKEYYKQYNETEKGIKGNRISNWKFKGVIHQNFDELYEKYINTEFCELCSVKLTEDKRTTHTTRCLDHCHESGEFRNVVCHRCNTKRG